MCTFLKQQSSPSSIYIVHHLHPAGCKYFSTFGITRYINMINSRIITMRQRIAITREKVEPRGRELSCNTVVNLISTKHLASCSSFSFTACNISVMNQSHGSYQWYFRLQQAAVSKEKALINPATYDSHSNKRHTHTKLLFLSVGLEDLVMKIKHATGM